MIKTESTEQRTLVVLVIEDQRSQAELIRMQLQMVDPKAFHVILHHSVSEAAQMVVTEFHPDVILLDLNLSDSSGAETVRLCREHFPDPAIVVLTGMDDHAVAREALAYGAEDYLVKGAAPELLSKAVHYAVLRHERDASDRLARAVFRYSSDGILVMDGRGWIQAVNQALCQMTGYNEQALIDKSIHFLSANPAEKDPLKLMMQVLIEAGQWEGELWCRRASGEVFVARVRASAEKGPQERLIQIVALISDVTEQRRYQEAIEYKAYHDALTGLPNRTLLQQRFHQTAAWTRRTQAHLLVAYFDLDGFKPINDTHGHAAGDEVLRVLTQRLKVQLREEDTLARLGGDEFVLVAQVSDVTEAKALLQRLHALMRDPIQWQNLDLEVSASVGAVVTDGREPLDSLLERTDQSMYQAKQAGRDRICYVVPTAQT